VVSSKTAAVHALGPAVDTLWRIDLTPLATQRSAATRSHGEPNDLPVVASRLGCGHGRELRRFRG